MLNICHWWFCWLSLHGASVNGQSTCRWPKSGHGLDTEALVPLQSYLAHKDDCLPILWGWLFADVFWLKSIQKDADEGNHQTVKYLEIKSSGKFTFSGLSLFLKEPWLAWLPSICVWVCFQGITWHFSVGMYMYKWDKGIHKCSALVLTPLFISLCFLKGGKNKKSKKKEKKSPVD